MSTCDAPGNASASPAEAAAARVPGLAGPVPLGIAGFAVTAFAPSCVSAGSPGRTAPAPAALGPARFHVGLWLPCFLIAPRLASSVAADGVGPSPLRRLISVFRSMTIAAPRTGAAVLTFSRHPAPAGPLA